MKEKMLKTIENNTRDRKNKSKNSSPVRREILAFNLLGNFLPLILLFIFGNYFKNKRGLFYFLFVLFVFLAFYSTYRGLKNIVIDDNKVNSKKGYGDK